MGNVCGKLPPKPHPSPPPSPPPSAFTKTGTGGDGKNDNSIDCRKNTSSAINNLQLFNSPQRARAGSISKGDRRATPPTTPTRPSGGSHVRALIFGGLTPPPTGRGGARSPLHSPLKKSSSTSFANSSNNNSNNNNSDAYASAVKHLSSPSLHYHHRRLYAASAPSSPAAAARKSLGAAAPHFAAAPTPRLGVSGEREHITRSKKRSQHQQQKTSTAATAVTAVNNGSNQGTTTMTLHVCRTLLDMVGLYESS
jgi:hypothetical protein